MIVALEDLACIADVAERLGVPVKRINRWAERSGKIGFPEPVYSYGQHRIYRFSEVKGWHDRWVSTRQ